MEKDFYFTVDPENKAVIISADGCSGVIYYYSGKEDLLEDISDYFDYCDFDIFEKRSGVMGKEEIMSMAGREGVNLKELNTMLDNSKAVKTWRCEYIDTLVDVYTYAVIFTDGSLEMFHCYCD